MWLFFPPPTQHTNPYTPTSSPKLNQRKKGKSGRRQSVYEGNKTRRDETITKRKNRIRQPTQGNDQTQNTGSADHHAHICLCLCCCSRLCLCHSISCYVSFSFFLVLSSSPLLCPLSKSWILTLSFPSPTKYTCHHEHSWKCRRRHFRNCQKHVRNCQRRCWRNCRRHYEVVWPQKGHWVCCWAHARQGLIALILILSLTFTLTRTLTLPNPNPSPLTISFCPRRRLFSCRLCVYGDFLNKNRISLFIIQMCR